LIDYFKLNRFSASADEENQRHLEFAQDFLADPDAVWKDSGAETSMNFKRKLINRNEASKGPGGLTCMSLAFLLGCTVAAQAQVTFAGTQLNLAPGAWNTPASVAVDGHGNLYIADGGNNQVVEMSPLGSGFGPPVPILSGLSAPGGVASDWNGNVFVSDTGNGRIVMLPVTSAGFEAPVTVASGLSSPNGLAVDTSDNVYVAQSGSNNVIEIPNSSGGYLSPVVVVSFFIGRLCVCVFL
jgi:hypothetical protein